MKGAFVDASREGLELLEADYVIVGSGAGGGAAARVLASTGRSVVVLEEGPRLDTASLGATAWRSLSRLYRRGGQMVTLGQAPMPILQGRCVGGTTFVNSAIIWRLPETIIHRWRTVFGLAGAFSDEEIDAAYRTLEEELHVRPVEDDTLSASDDLMRIGAGRAGIDSRAIRRSEDGCRASSRCFHGCPHDAKQSTAINSLRRATLDGAVVFSSAEAELIEVRGGRAVAVRGRLRGDGPERGQRFRIAARRAVVVCASVVQSPNLLRRSRIASSSSALGEHFMVHPGTSMAAVYPHEVRTWSGAAQGFEAYGLRDTLGVKFETINVVPEVAASRLPGAGAGLARWIERLPHMAIWAVALRADTEGSVRPSRLLGGELIRYSLIRTDVERLRLGLKRLAEMHFLAGATEVLPNVLGLPEVLRSPDELRLFDEAPVDARAYHTLGTHLFGTCRAGTDPRASVVDPDLQVHGVEGLYVMDASVFPTNTGVNPQHSIMAWATVAARRLAARSS